MDCRLDETGHIWSFLLLTLWTQTGFGHEPHTVITVSLPVTEIVHICTYSIYNIIR